MTLLKRQRWRTLIMQDFLRHVRTFNLYHLVRKILFLLDAEFVHHFTVFMLKKGIGPRIKNGTHKSLNIKVCGLDFPNPIGLAAGFDKQAELIGEMLNFGFGFVELGTVTPLPQAGNPTPRLFRAPHAEALINRFGFNSDGFELCLRRVIAHHDASVKKKAGVIGVNVGKNKESADAIADYVTGVKTFMTSVDYMTVNISSPNTPGLRDLQSREALEALLKAVMETRNSSRKKPPIFVKVAPDLTEQQQKDIADVVLATAVDGLIVGNTTVTRSSTLPPAFAKEAGGLSGKPLFDLSTRVLGNIYKLTNGKIPLIGCGGIFTGTDVYAKIRAGASLVQIYTSLIYEGPFLVARLNRELAALLKHDGFRSVQEAVGVDAKF